MIESYIKESNVFAPVLLNLLNLFQKSNKKNALQSLEFDLLFGKFNNAWALM